MIIAGFSTAQVAAHQGLVKVPPAMAVDVTPPLSFIVWSAAGVRGSGDTCVLTRLIFYARHGWWAGLLRCAAIELGIRDGTANCCRWRHLVVRPSCAAANADVG